MSTFVQESALVRALVRRAQACIAQAGKVSFFLSGGSASSLALHAFRLGGLIDRAEPVYIQFDDFNWIEREQARRECHSMGTTLSTIEFSERSWVREQGDWRSLSLTERESLLWSAIAKRVADKIRVGSTFSGHGFLEFHRLESSADFTERAAVRPNCFLQPFFNSDLNRVIAKDSRTLKFLELSGRIPFDDFRYWSDFVFSSQIPEFLPREARKWSDTLRVFR